MAKRKKRENDFSVTAFRVVQEATGQMENPEKKTLDAKALGYLGGSKGGKAKAEKLSTKRKVEIARKAVRARLGKSP